MNQTDVADQLRMYYRPDGLWFRMRKWWSIFVWALDVVTVNSYLIYKKIYSKNHTSSMKRLLFFEKLVDQLAHPPGSTKKNARKQYHD